MKESGDEVPTSVRDALFPQVDGFADSVVDMAREGVEEAILGQVKHWTECPRTSGAKIRDAARAAALKKMGQSTD